MRYSRKETHSKDMNRRKKTFMGILAALLAILMILPILITILSPAGAVTRAEMNRLKEGRRSWLKEADLKNQMSSIENEQKAINAKELIDQQITPKEEIKTWTRMAVGGSDNRKGRGIQACPGGRAQTV